MGSVYETSAHEEVPWHVTDPDPDYGDYGDPRALGAAQNFPQIDKMPLFTSVPSALHSGT